MSQHLEFADIGMSVCDYAKIQQSGRRVTRGTKNQIINNESQQLRKIKISIKNKKQKQKKGIRNNKMDQSNNNSRQQRNISRQQNCMNKTDKNDIEIKQFLGQFNLQQYLYPQKIQINSNIINNKNIKQLYRGHIPQQVLFLERTLFKIDQFQIKNAKINSKKTKSNNILLQINSTIRNITDENGYLLFIQTIGFYHMNFETFQQLFHKQIKNNLDIEKQSKNQNEPDFLGDSYSDINLSKTIINPIKKFQIEQINKFKNMSQQNQNLNSHQMQIQNQQLKITRKKQLEQNINLDLNISQNKSQENNKISYMSYQRILFNKLCYCQRNYIIWPVLVMQPWNCELNTIEQIICKNKIISSNNNDCFDFKNILDDNYQQSSVNQHKNQKIIPQEIIMESNENLIKQQNNNSKDHITIKHNKIIVKLFFIDKLMVVDSNVTTWKNYSLFQINKICDNILFYNHHQQINNCIEMLNKFYMIQNSQLKMQQSRLFLNHIAKYKIDKYNINFNLCLLLRTDNNKNDKKVLVLFLDKIMINNNNNNRVQWISIDHLIVNYALPIINFPQIIYLYLLDQNIPLEIILNNIYMKFLQNQSNIQSIFQQAYNSSLENSNNNNLNNQRCIQCNFMLHNLQWLQCFFCSKFCHKQCIQRQQNQLTIQQEQLNSTFPSNWLQQCKNIIIGNNSNNLHRKWICNNCQPCYLCFQSFNNCCNDYLKCTRCLNKYHITCGRTKYYEDNVELYKEKYLCLICLKCRMCQRKLKDKQYSFINKQLFCQDCVERIKNKQYCNICMEFKYGRWYQCDHCYKWYHQVCDKLLMSSYKPEKDTIYWCFNCRKLQRRRIVCLCIDVIKSFDQYQFFTDPQYENLYDYSSIVEESMCLCKMKQRCLQGEYDSQPFKTYESDFQLIINNALKYNMPKDQAHYQARVLNILGTLAFRYLKDVIECADEQLHSNNVYKLFKQRQYSIYQNIYEKYPEILLNFNTHKSYIEVINKSNYQLNEPLIFSSRYILNQIFKNSTIKLHIKKKPLQIKDLFTITKQQPAYWKPIRQNYCYLHPQQQQSKIIYICQICHQNYCCTRKCLIHRICSCEKRQCSCDNYQCECLPLKTKDKKNMENKLLMHYGFYNIRQLTHNYKYCLKCCLERINQWDCYLCHKYCYFSWQKCLKCGKVYHNSCENQVSKGKINIFFPSSAQNTFKTIRLQNQCSSCSYGNKNLIKLEQNIRSQCQILLMQMKRILQYIEPIKEIYQHIGIRITQTQLFENLRFNYNEFCELQSIFQEYLINSHLILEKKNQYNLEINQYRNQILQQIPNSISEIYVQYKNKIINQYLFPYEYVTLFSINRQISGYVDTNLSNILRNQIKELKQFSLISHVKNNKIYQEQIEINFVILTSLSQIQINIQWKLLSDKNHHLNYKNLSPNQILFVFSSFLNMQSNYCQNEFFHFLKFQYISGINKNKNQSLLIQNPSLQYSSLIWALTCHKTNLKDQSFICYRSYQIYETLRQFLQRVYEENKCVLRRGSTCILKCQQTCWKVLKKREKENNFQIQLSKYDDKWFLMINQQRWIVNTIEQLLYRINKISLVTNFKQLATYLGFTLEDILYYKANHFTNFLQTNPLDSMSLKQRKERIISLYDQFKWKLGGICQQQGKKYKSLKKKIFYLEKRNVKFTTLENYKQLPYITFEDIKRDLDDINTHKNDNFIPHTPSEMVFIAPSKIHKLGLFAKKQAYKGTVVLQYIGEIISQSIADKRQQQFHYGCYMFGLNRRNIDRKDIIDATFRGNMARYLNHSCDPNCKAKIDANGRKIPRIFIYTIRDINKFEQLTYDYQFSVQNGAKIECTCGAKNCQGRLN